MLHPKFLSVFFYLVTGFMNSNPILWLLLTFAYGVGGKIKETEDGDEDKWDCFGRLTII